MTTVARHETVFVPHATRNREKWVQVRDVYPLLDKFLMPFGCFCASTLAPAAAIGCVHR